LCCVYIIDLGQGGVVIVVQCPALDCNFAVGIGSYRS
jgi:hypothetical protein